MKRVIAATLVEVARRLAERVLTGKLDKSERERRESIDDAIARRIRELKEKKQ